MREPCVDQNAFDMNWDHVASSKGMHPFELLEQATRDVQLVLLPAAHSVCVRDAMYALLMPLERRCQAVFLKRSADSATHTSLVRAIRR